MTLTVAFTVNNRPRYLTEALASWSQVRGIEKAHLLFRCEPGCPEAVDLCEAVDFAPRTVVVSPRRLGVLAAPWHALDGAFAAGARFAVLAEDDLTVSTDVLEYFTWCMERWQQDKDVLAVTTHQHQEQPGGPPGVRAADWRNPDSWHFWVWGTWAGRWEKHLRADWDFTYTHKGWDWRIRDHWVLERGMRVLAPSLSRSQHIGEHGGTHASPAQFGALRSRCFTQDVPPQDYQEVP